MVSIVVLNYKNWQDTIECLNSLSNITYHSFRVIVVDNDSKNDSLAYIGNWLTKKSKKWLMLTRQRSENIDHINEDFVLIQSDSNCGYAAGNNIGIRCAIRADDKYVLILNNDTLVEKNFLEPLVDFLDSNPSVGMVGPKIVDVDGSIDKNCARRRPEMIDYLFIVDLFAKLFPNNRWLHKHYYIGEYDYQTPRLVDIISGACMLLRTDIIKEIGLLDEKTFLYLEELILHEKLRLLNKSTYIVPQSKIVHKGGNTTNIIPSSFIMQTLQESRQYYFRSYRHFSAWFLYIQKFLNNIYFFMKLLKKTIKTKRINNL
jgi:GT2 family glycosyltransferase